jgi:hypothetical protein
VLINDYRRPKAYLNFNLSLIFGRSLGGEWPGIVNFTGDTCVGVSKMIFSTSGDLEGDLLGVFSLFCKLSKVDVVCKSSDLDVDLIAVLLLFCKSPELDVDCIGVLTKSFSKSTAKSLSFKTDFNTGVTRPPFLAFMFFGVLSNILNEGVDGITLILGFVVGGLTGVETIFNDEGANALNLIVGIGVFSIDLTLNRIDLDALLDSALISTGKISEEVESTEEISDALDSAPGV